MKNLWALNKYLWRYRWHLLLGILFVSSSNIFRVWQPKVIGRALDSLQELLGQYESTLPGPGRVELVQEIGHTLGRFALVVLAMALTMGLFMFLMRQTIVVMSRLIERDLREDMFKHYEKLHQSFYRKNKTGDLMSRITEDISKVRMYLGPAILYGINLSTLVIFAVSSMLQVNAQLTLYSLLPLPILSISIYYVSAVINVRSERIQSKLADLNSYAQESYSGIRVIKSYVMERLFGETFLKKCNEYMQSSLGLAQVNALFFPLILLLIGLSTLLTVYVGGIYVQKGLITTGNIAEFVIYVNMLTWPVTSIGWVASIIQQAEASQKRINDFLDTEPLITSPTEDDRPLRGYIQFDNVSFVYPDTGIEALKNVSFEIKPGEKVILLGRTASGKTTVVDLLMRLFDVSQGSIRIDGVDIREMDLYNLRKRIGYIPQDVFLFSDTVANNIAFAEEDVERSVVEAFAKRASLHEDIMDFEDGYDTRVGERGVTLSGGQKQRVAIARTLLESPDIVLIDDSLSAVDSETEMRIVQYLNEELKDRTSLIITHRLNAQMDYDAILVLDEGRLVEKGSHDQLMELNGHYYDMYQRQILVDA